MFDMATAGASPGFVTSMPQRNRTMTYLRALTFTAWCFLLLVHYWHLREWDSRIALMEEGVDIKQLYYVGIGIAILGHLTLGWQAWMNVPFEMVKTWPSRLMTCFCLMALVLAPMSVSPRTSATYAVATLVVLALGYLYWEGDYVILRRVLAFTGALILAWLYILMVHHGFIRGIGSTVGGINRNLVGKATLAGILLCSFSGSQRFRLISLAAGGGVLLAVTSRGSILAVSVFLAVYFVLLKGTARTMVYGILAVFLAAAVLLASQFAQEAVFEDVMRLHDTERGLGTGFTGRLETWERGLEEFQSHPIFGFGFRTSGGEAGANAHGGYIRMLIEMGFVGTMLAVSAVGLEILRRRRFCNDLRGRLASGLPGVDVAESIRLNAIVAGVMCAMLTLWVYEPIYLNLGTVMSLLFFLSLGAPTAVPAPTAGYAGAQAAR